MPQDGDFLDFVGSSATLGAYHAPRGCRMRQKSKQPEPELGPLQLPIDELCCVNEVCRDRGVRGQGNLSVRNKGKARSGWRMLRCSTCKKEFSERKGTAFSGMKMPPERAQDIAKHLKERCGVRKTARLTGASKNGVTSVAIRLGLHAKAQHDTDVQDLTAREAQFDEGWAFVEKKDKNCDPDDPDDLSKGSQWDHTAVDVSSRFVVSLAIGKRNKETLKEVVSDFAGRTGGAPPP